MTGSDIKTLYTDFLKTLAKISTSAIGNKQVNQKKDKKFE